MDLSLLAQADSATLKLELAKAAFESAKANLEQAKQAHEAFLSQADEQGVPRAKLKKLAEDRVQALLESGILAAMGLGDGKAAEAKRPRKGAKKAEEGEPNEAPVLEATAEPPAMMAN